jgi:hypothetical protein
MEDGKLSIVECEHRLSQRNEQSDEAYLAPYHYVFDVFRHVVRPVIGQDGVQIRIKTWSNVELEVFLGPIAVCSFGVRNCTVG